MNPREGSSQDPVARLIRLGGSSSPIPGDAELRVRAAVHAAWRDEVEARRRRVRRWTALAALITLALALYVLFPRSVDEPARLVVADGSGLWVDGEPVAIGSESRRGDRLETRDGGAALAWTGGTSLRLHERTRVRLLGDGALRLDQGAVYLDVGADDEPAGLEDTEPAPPTVAVHTDFGVVRDIGTRFEVRASSGELRIRVREGRVELQQDEHTFTADAGTELVADQDGVRVGSVEVHGEVWTAYRRLAPPFELDGSTLRDYLRWLQRETGWTLTFASPELLEEAAATRLHGSLDGVSVEAGVQRVLPICGLVGRLVGDGVFEIRALDAEPSRPAAHDEDGQDAAKEVVQ